MDNNKFISLDDFTRVLDDVVTKINENYVKKEQNIQTKTVFIFKYNDTIPTQLPAYINWDVAQDIVTISVSEGWMLNTDEYAANGRALWMSSGTITSLEPNTITWATPIRLTGERGPAGLDGTILEYKYRLTQNDLSVPLGPEAAPEEWHSTPSGVTISNQAEWVSSRYKETTDSDFTPWTTPVLWAKYGVNGVDGNGYEYIYYRNNGEGTPSLGEYDVNSAEYQLDEYLPSGWSDDPQSVSADQRYVWMSSRKKQNQTWSAFKTPVVWAKFGEKGDTGYLIKTMYTKTDGESAPYYVYNNINPGSSWSSQMPSYATGEYVWEIKAYFNSNNEFVTITGSDGHTLYGWGSPILVSGIKGDTGNVPNYKIYVYKFSETQPSKPSTDSPTNVTGWDDYPTDMGNAQGRWWQSIGSVNGNSGLVTNWTDPMPISGIDGQHTEFRFKITTDTTTPEIINNVREPEGWARLNDMTDTTVPAGGSMWQVTAEIDDKNNLIGNWSHPVKISGEKGERGERGPVGERGFTGLPGSNITYRYALGDANSVKTSWQNEVTTLKTTDAYPYIWAQIGRDVYEDKDNNGTYEFARTEWDPNGIFIMSGKPGQNGKGGQLVYPAGQYDPNAVYITTEKIAPYVYYDGEYYVLNDVMTWVGTEQNNKTPNESECWIEFDGFQALHTQVGIIENGLIGSAVFNGDYMFSQWGICNDGTVIDENTSSETLRSCFEQFNADDPYGEAATFKPNICFNLKTGKVWMNAGKTVFNSDGSGFLADGKISWDFDGEIDVKQLNALGIVASDISADTITGKTITCESGSFVLDATGTFSLGNDAITYDGDDISISGDNVHINGDVKINGTAVLNSIDPNVDSDAYNRFAQMSQLVVEDLIAESIEAAVVRTDMLETKPDEDTDKIHIEDNYIHCLNDDGERNLIISSDNVNTDYVNGLFVDKYTEENDTIVSRIDITKNSSNGTSYPYTNSAHWYHLVKEPSKIGRILKGSDITVYAALALYKSTNYNSLQPNYESAANWQITKGGEVPSFSPNISTYLVGGGGTPEWEWNAGGGYIIIYRADSENGEYTAYKSKKFYGAWTDADSPWSSSTLKNTKRYKTHSTTETIDHDGYYAIKLCLEPESVYYSKSALYSISGLLNINVNQNIPSTYTEIGKNGIITYNNGTAMMVDNNGFIVKARTSLSSDAFYGIKINKYGMYFCNGGTSWRPWAPSSD